MRWLMPVLLICLPTLHAQEAKPPSPRQRYQALVEEYEAADGAWNKRYDARSKSDAELDLVARHRDWPGWSFAPRFLELAEGDPDDPAATDALVWVVDRSRNVGVKDRELLPLIQRALELLGRGGRLDDRRLAEACRSALTYPSPPTEHFLRAALEEGRDREARGLVCLCLAKLLSSKGMIARDPWFDREAKSPFDVYSISRLHPDYVRYCRDADAVASEGEAERLFERVLTDYGDVVYHRAVGKAGHDVTVGEVARSALHELRDLAVDKIAPEIEGEDIDGRPLKLSDHRGKVVVLTFWATWCGPCMGLVPHERALVDRLAVKPFVLLGVDGDMDRDRAKKVVAEERISWRSWWNGGPSGLITESYSVDSWPTVYVLDARGVIRYKQVVRERLDEAVDALLKEMETARP